MASSLEFVNYVCDQLSGAGTITWKRMFGEFGLWCDGSFFATVEDDMLCLKITDAGRALLPEARIVEPHEGARLLYVEELDDRARMAELAVRRPVRRCRSQSHAGKRVSDLCVRYPG